MEMEPDVKKLKEGCLLIRWGDTELLAIKLEGFNIWEAKATLSPQEVGGAAGEAKENNYLVVVG